MLQLLQAVKYQFNDETIASLFGQEAAEREDVSRLKEYFMRRSEYESIRSKLPLKIIVGFKGVGKSAALKVSYQEDLDHGVAAIWVRPDDVTELYSDLTNERNTLKLITLWKKGLARLIASRIASDWVMVSSDKAQHAIKWAEEAGYRTKDFISQVAKLLRPLAKPYVDQSETVQVKAGEHHILEGLVKGQEVRIYMDDLDRGWSATEDDRLRMVALINALGDLTSDIPTLRARVSIRTDVYLLIKGTDQSMDKFEGNVVWCKWENHDILIALIKRMFTYFNQPLDEDELQRHRQSEIAQLLSPVFEQKFTDTLSWNGKPTFRVMMSVIRRRPRDIVKLCTAAAKKAYEEKSSTITGRHIESILEDYSSGRMDDVIIEFKGDMPNISDFLYTMGPTTEELKNKNHERYVYTTDELLHKIANVASSVPVSSLPGTTKADAHDIAQFLFRIGFITARKDLDDHSIERYFYEQKKQLLKARVGDLGFSWEIHPAFRGALARKRKATERWQDTVVVSADENADEKH